MWDDLGVTLGEYRGGDVPEGCVVASDGYREWLVYAPDVVRQMRHDCPECNGSAP
jgi:hypothetical protein